VKSSSKQTSEP